MQKKQHFFTPDSTFAYVCLLPSMVALAVFMFYPIGYVFVMAFYKTNMVGDLERFVGWNNFQDLFESRKFIAVIIRTILWTTLAVVIKMVIGLMIGLALNQTFKGRKTVRALVILPWATSIPISVMLWQWTFNAEYGLLNHTLETLGIWSNPPIWLATSWSAFTATLSVDIWLGLSFLGLVYLAGLQSIPAELYEAAKIDGATWWQQFYHVTIPSMRKVLMIVTLLSFFWTFNDFNTIFILTNGGPAGSTEILVTYLYRHGFEFLKWHQASAIAVVTFFILILTSMLYAYFYKKYDE